MSRSIIKRLTTVRNRLTKLAEQYRQLQNPASIHFDESAEELDRIINNPKSVDEGSQINLTSLYNQVDELTRKYGSSVKTFQFNFRKEMHSPPHTVDCTLARLFPSTDTYDKHTERFYGLHVNVLTSTVEEWLKKHVKEAEDNGVELTQDIPISVDKKNESEPFGDE